MKLVTAIIRPNKLEDVKDALTRIGVTGITVTESRGHGRQKRRDQPIYRSADFSLRLPPKITLETVVPDELVGAVVECIKDEAFTGEIGDGRIFVTAVEQVHHIGSGEKEEGCE